MFEYYFHLASKWYGFKQAYVVPLVYKKKHYWGKQSCVSYLGGYYYFPFLFNLWIIIMLEYLKINQCQCCEVVVVVFIYSHPAYRVCWHKAFIYLYGCIWLVEYHTQRKRKTYYECEPMDKTDARGQQHRIICDTADPKYPVEQTALLPSITFLEIRISSWQKNKRPWIAIYRCASLVRFDDCFLLPSVLSSTSTPMLCVVLNRYINWVLLRTAFWRKERLWWIETCCLFKTIESYNNYLKLVTHWKSVFLSLKIYSVITDMSVT